MSFPLARQTRGSTHNPFPPTRYQGSKRKLAQAIVEELGDLPVSTVLDAFGGTAAVAHAFKRAGKAVTYNDLLEFNHQIGLALIENDSVQLAEPHVASLGVRQPGVEYRDFIQRTFHGIYFTPQENRWLDTAAANIHRMECPYRRALAWFAVFQAAMAKRPYNLFHRSNLYMRLAEVPRGFGNKASWDRPFEQHTPSLAARANAAIVNSHGRCRATRGDALQVESEFDLVYVDTPYINRAGRGVNYRDFYHFLEGIVQYHQWPAMIDETSRHRRLRLAPDPWSDASACREMFRRLFHRFRHSHLAVSYRSEGIPSIEELADLLREVKRRVRVVEIRSYQYALSTRRDSHEMLLIATD